MVRILKWLQDKVDNVVDPDSEERIGHLARALYGAISKHRKDADVAKATQNIEFKKTELAAAQERVYRRILSKGWADGELNAKEREVAKWVAAKLDIASRQAEEINLEFARSCFGNALAEAMEDGVLDDAEEERLSRICKSVGSSVSEFVRSYFSVEGEHFLRSVFLSCVEDGHLSQKEWKNLLVATSKLGIEEFELAKVIQPQARRFVEHVLVDAREDGRISASEKQTLDWLANNLGLPADYTRYVKGEVERLELLTEIDDGHLPRVSPPIGLAVRAGEITHLCRSAVWRQTRHLKSGPRVNDHYGTLVLTDSRMVFVSDSKSLNITYRRIVSHSGSNDRINVQISSKPRLTFFFSDDSPVPYAIFNSAVAMENQTKTAKRTKKRSRHVPRDVRQRVWQRYGGRCADCEANDYLEVDHIIPVAKGGSNSDANVQLLCRRCNLKKSDRI